MSKSPKQSRKPTAPLPSVVADRIVTQTLAEASDFDSELVGFFQEAGFSKGSRDAIYHLEHAAKARREEKEAAGILNKIDPEDGAAIDTAEAWFNFGFALGRRLGGFGGAR